MKLAFDMSIFTAPSGAISQGMRLLDRGSAVWTALRAASYHFEMS